MKDAVSMKDATSMSKYVKDCNSDSKTSEYCKSVGSKVTLALAAIVALIMFVTNISGFLSEDKGRNREFNRRDRRR